MASSSDHKANVSKFISTYKRLLQGQSVPDPQIFTDVFWSDLLALPVLRDWLVHALDALSPETCMGQLKPTLSEMFAQLIRNMKLPNHDQSQKWNALRTCIIYVGCLLNKAFAGWEVMELFAGDVARSDEVFTEFASATFDILNDSSNPVNWRYGAVELALVFMCKIDQLSPGAYFLRPNFFSGITKFILETENSGHIYHSTILLASLANFHRSDAEQLNPYARRLASLSDQIIFRKILENAAENVRLNIRSFQDVVDDRPASLLSSFSSMLTSLRPNGNALSNKVETPTEKFAHLPLHQIIFLVPFYDMFWANSSFRGTFVQDQSPLPPQELISLFSYLLTHSWSPSSRRASTYARLALNIMLISVEDKAAFGAICDRRVSDMHICRQRRPVLNIPSRTRCLLEGILDCCVLFLRHNLHKDLDTWAYSICLHTLHLIILELIHRKTKLNYAWREVWITLLNVIAFIANRTDARSLRDKAVLQRQGMTILFVCVVKWETFLAGIGDVTQLVFEIMRSAPLFTQPVSGLNTRAQSELGKLAEQFEEIVKASHAKTPEQILRIIGERVDRDGVLGHLPSELSGETWEIRRPSDVHLQMGFSRLLFSDGVAAAL